LACRFRFSSISKKHTKSNQTQRDGHKPRQTQQDGHKPRQTRKSFAIITQQKSTEHPCDIIAEKKVTAR
jgi:hypothetical protein